MKIVLILLLMLNLSCKKKEEVKTEEAVIPEVQVTKIVKKPLQLRKATTGFIEAAEKVEIRARIDGFLEKKLFNDGQKVKKGDKLFIIEQDKYLADVNAKKADLTMALASENLDKLQYERAEKLLKDNAIAKAKYDEQAAAYAVSKAKVGQAKAALKEAELDLSYTAITAPIDGIISDNNYDTGNYVSLQSSPLTTLINSDTVNVNFTVSEKYFFDILKQIGGKADVLNEFAHKAAKAVLILPSGEEYPLKGTITFVDNLIDKETNTLRIKAKFANPNHVLKDGGYAKIYLETVKPEPSFVIPQTLILVDQQGRYVFVIGKDGKTEIRRITTGGNYGSDILVESGLKEGEMMITGGYQSLRPGMNVKVKNLSETSAAGK